MTILMDNTPLPGFDHVVTVREQIESADLSGETSLDADAHGGWKPAMIEVRCQFRYDRLLELATLRGLFHAREAGTDAPKVYEITENTCLAMGIRKVRFTEGLRVEKMGGRDLWSVAFTLKETSGIPARTEERAEPAAEETPQIPGATIDTAGLAAQAQQTTSYLEGIMAKVNTLAGKYIFKDEGEAG